MYKQTRNQEEPKTLTCPECRSTKFSVNYSKVVCQNCGWSAKRGNNKYGAKRTTANDGKKRDSKFEASVADELDLRKRVGDIKDYDSQYKVEMWAYDKNGKQAMKKTHKVDFRLHLNDGSYELVEAKGAVTSDYLDRRRWLETFWLPFNPDHTYTVIKQKDRRR